MRVPTMPDGRPRAYVRAVRRQERRVDALCEARSLLLDLMSEASDAGDVDRVLLIGDTVIALWSIDRRGL